MIHDAHSSNPTFAKPLITVLLSAYNNYPYLKEAVESIIAQTETRWKMIVINDGSTDESKDYLDRLSDPRIEIIHQENHGLSYALNRGLERCDTKYIARMDGDDISYPDRFEKQLRFLESHPEVALLGTQLHRFGSGKVDSGTNLPLKHDDIFDGLMKGQHAFCHATMMVRREAMEQLGPDPYPEGVGEDWPIFLQIGEKWKLANLPNHLFGYRYHSASINGSKMRELRSRIRYACECSRRRVANLPSVTFEQYLESENDENVLVRVCRNIENSSRAYYHSGVSDLLGKRPIRGYAKLCFAAASAPNLTLHRVSRTVRGLLSPKPDQP